MKIAVMTQPLGSNYGGIMQAFALQKVLRDYGHEVITIDRRNDKGSFILQAGRVLRSFFYRILSQKNAQHLSAKERCYVFHGMKKFIQNNISLSAPIHSTEALKDYFSRANFELVVIGSDQVWRPKYSPNIYNFFGNAVVGRAAIVAYAASFGVDEWEYTPVQTEHCKKLAKKFSAISVRERGGVKLCKEYLGVDPLLVLDPTMLVKREEYETLARGQAPTNKKAVLKYILDDTEVTQQYVNTISRHLGMSIFSAQPRKRLEIGGGHIDDYKFPEVEAWVASFRDAEFVVTDSYHGCVFSLIFNKPFVAIGNKDRGLSRFDTLLSHFGLENRLVLESYGNIAALVDTEIDWISVNNIMAEKRNLALKYIENWSELVAERK